MKKKKLLYIIPILLLSIIIPFATFNSKPIVTKAENETYDSVTFCLPTLPLNYINGDNYRVVNSMPMYLTITETSATITYYRALTSGVIDKHNVKLSTINVLNNSSIQFSLACYFITTNNVHIYSPRVQIEFDIVNSIFDFSTINSFKLYTETIYETETNYYHLDIFNSDDYLVCDMNIKFITECEAFENFEIDGDLTLLNSNSSYQNGYTNGYNYGYELGVSYGKNLGFNQGVASANQYSFTGLLTSVIDVPINSFKSLLNFDFLDINILDFALSLLTLFIILKVVKLINGG